MNTLDQTPSKSDPTELTTEQLLRVVSSERDYTDGRVAVLIERLNGMDTATKLLSETVNRVPTEVTKEVSHLKGLSEERFTSVETQFKERDTRSERESKDNKVAVDAAFAAQKEAASEQNKSNTLAIDKSEKATAETLNKQADLFRSTTDGLLTQITDVKERIGKVESIKLGAQEQRVQTKDNIGLIYIIMGIIALVVSVISTLIAHNFTQ